MKQLENIKKDLLEKELEFYHEELDCPGETNFAQGYLEGVEKALEQVVDTLWQFGYTDHQNRLQVKGLLSELQRVKSDFMYEVE